MTRFAAERRVFYVEEPIIVQGGRPHMKTTVREPGVIVVTPVIPENHDVPIASEMKRLIDAFIKENNIRVMVNWYYSPMFLPWTRHLQPAITIYDCMDELSAFKNAPGALQVLEQDLLSNADLVFTGGLSLFEAKKTQSPEVYAFPSSVDTNHFARARRPCREPEDQESIPHFRLGFLGVIDERMDIDLLAEVARLRPHWHLVMIGPVVKIDPAQLPTARNIHYLGQKSYADLPGYLAGWDVALLPFARNHSTRFISPTKTPEYLAAGRPVVSTSIKDVIRTYGDTGIVHIADEPQDFVKAVEAALAEDPVARMQKVDELLRQTSWCRTWGRMSELIADAFERRRANRLSHSLEQITQTKLARAGGAV